MVTKNGTLEVWMNREHVATWRVKSGSHSLTYADSWLSSKHSRPISLSLPLQGSDQATESVRVESFFNNLLPDSSSIRSRIASRYKTGATDAFSLLQEVGQDCVGAIQLLKEGETPGDITAKARKLTESDVANILRNIHAPWLESMVHDDEMRISLAGAQEKTALLYTNDSWHIPLAHTPTTHILKLPLGLVGNAQADMRTSVENEWLCSKIFNAFGVKCADTKIATFEDQKALVVKRFDRIWSKDDKTLLRLPQEDMCQALGLPNTKKYQADGGPGIEIINNLLSSAGSTLDCENFFKAQILFWMLAATDGHSKNFSIFLQPGGKVKLTPIYDVLSVYPVLGKGVGQFSPFKVRLAMAVRGKSKLHYKLNEIQPYHWFYQAAQIGLDATLIIEFAEMLADTYKIVFDQIGSQFPADFPSQVSDTIFKGMEKRIQSLALS